jgi:hypothetical protein
MQTRIVFNGKEYAGLEEMPDDVRKEFGARLAQLAADADGSGVPDVLEGKRNVTGFETSISVNGRPVENLNDLPLPLRLLMGYAIRRVAATPLPESRPPASGALLRRLDATSNALGTLLYGISALAGAGLAAIGIWMIVHMDAGSRSQGGALYLGIGVVIALAWTVGSLISLALRRR